MAHITLHQMKRSQIHSFGYFHCIHVLSYVKLNKKTGPYGPELIWHFGT